MMAVKQWVPDHLRRNKDQRRSNDPRGTVIGLAGYLAVSIPQSDSSSGVRPQPSSSARGVSLKPAEWETRHKRNIRHMLGTSVA
jgi:hypothetical protein